MQKRLKELIIYKLNTCFNISNSLFILRLKINNVKCIIHKGIFCNIHVFKSCFRNYVVHRKFVFYTIDLTYFNLGDILVNILSIFLTISVDC
jgi:hypothetical protein